jgi:large subunit ribosomal protein L9
MRVVFLEEVEGTARTGDVKNVAGGFARNYLLPRKLAAPATEHYINIAQQKATKEGRRQVKLDDEAQKLVPQVDGKEITIEVRVGDQDKMFGSVTARDIAEQLAKVTKIDLEHRQIDLKQPIRELGSHQVKVKLTRNVLATVTVNVYPIGGIPVPEAAAPEVEEETAEVAEPEATFGETGAAELEEEAGPAEVSAEAAAEEEAANKGGRRSRGKAPIDAG